MSDLGVFIDESGDVGSNSDFYLVTLIFHDQKHSIDDQVNKLSDELGLIGFSNDRAVHSGSIVRKEDDWKEIDLQKRRKVFSKMFSFMRLCPITYKTFAVVKKECIDRFSLRGRLANELGVQLPLFYSSL